MASMARQLTPDPRDTACRATPPNRRISTFTIVRSKVDYIDPFIISSRSIEVGAEVKLKPLYFRADPLCALLRRGS